MNLSPEAALLLGGIGIDLADLPPGMSHLAEPVFVGETALTSGAVVVPDDELEESEG